MECILETEEKTVYKDGNKTYTLINMGGYVGHRAREWYEPAPDFWELMFFDEEKNDEEKHHIEALIDDFGRYTRFIIEHGTTKRVLLLSNGFVYSDYINDTSDYKNPLGLGKLYYSLDRGYYDQDCPFLTDYLFSEHTFMSSDGEVFSKRVPGDEEIDDFLDKNIKLTSKKARVIKL